MGDVVVEEGAKVEYSIIDEGVLIGKDAIIGQPKDQNKGIALLGRGIKIADGMSVAGGEIVEKDLIKGEN